MFEAPTPDDVILIRAARFLGRVHTCGPRALQAVAFRDVEAMTLSLVILGLEPILPGDHTLYPTINPKGQK